MFELRRLLQRKADTIADEKNVNTVYHHNLFELVRKTPPFIHIPQVSGKNLLENYVKNLLDELHYKTHERAELTIEKLCEIGGYKPTSFSDDVKVFSIDNYTAIPYTIINSETDNSSCIVNIYQ